MNHLDEQSINALRILSADAIEKAKSGHPGLPLGCAPMAYELFAHQMKHNPASPDWFNRDRFILSAGHGSMLLYSLLYLFGYGKEGKPELTLSDLQNFRQLHSKCAGHPEYGHIAGIEATTGPLGAGMGMAVGMAIAEKHLAAEFNKEGFPVVDHYTFAIGGDGCMMEGISSEAFSLAGTLKLSKLIILYDSNRISIEGTTDLAFTENVQLRMQAFGFQTLEVEDGNDIDAIGKAIEAAKADRNRPSFITIHTQIGYGCPAKQGKASAHGEPLGAENVAAMKEFLHWENQEPFAVPEEVYAHYRELSMQHQAEEDAWKRLLEEYGKKYPEEAGRLQEFLDRDNQAKLDAIPDFWKKGEKPEATRSISGQVIQTIKEAIPTLIGGSADLAPSNKTHMDGVTDFSAEHPEGRNLHFGVREMAMSSIANGMLLHGGCTTYCATFFVFSDYTKPMARLASIMGIPQIFVFTHDSIGVGEDGPTHEPVEQLAMFRAMPNFHAYRPCDATEVQAAWYSALTSPHTPTAIILTRQNLTPMEGSSKEALRGGYILEDCEGLPQLILIASGSEVELAHQAAQILQKEGLKVRVVSMPCMDLFEEQEEAYQEKVLPREVKKRVAIEALSPLGLDRYTGIDGATIGMTGFGASAPYKELFPYFGFTAEHIVEVAKGIL